MASRPKARIAIAIGTSTRVMPRSASPGGGFFPGVMPRLEPRPPARDVSGSRDVLVHPEFSVEIVFDRHPEEILSVHVGEVDSAAAGSRRQTAARALG